MGRHITYSKIYIKYFKMLEVVYIVKFIVEICVGNKTSLVWMDTIDCYIGSSVDIVLVVKLRRSDAIRNVFHFTFISC
jgi:hypothetical protein